MSALLVKKLSPDARLPVRHSAHAAGYDLFSVQNVVIPPGGLGIVDTGVAMTTTIEDTYLRIAPRSGLAVKGITTGAGVVDRDYTASVRVVLYNLSGDPYSVAIGDRIAQAIIERIVTCEVVEVDDLAATQRGGGGFGSTGR